MSMQIHTKQKCNKFISIEMKSNFAKGVNHSIRSLLISENLRQSGKANAGFNRALLVSRDVERSAGSAGSAGRNVEHAGGGVVPKGGRLLVLMVVVVGKGVLLLLRGGRDGRDGRRLGGGRSGHTDHGGRRGEVMRTREHSRPRRRRRKRPRRLGHVHGLRGTWIQSCGHTHQDEKLDPETPHFLYVGSHSVHKNRLSFPTTRDSVTHLLDAFTFIFIISHSNTRLVSGYDRIEQ